ncbi:enoyl-CoA hydratase/isomerase family protein [Paraburkholderia rhizosphaerae]|nr:enoyl-CoA hydratase/isomerase family protein [Paraburkholderia rhizosphaerae]
MELPALDDIDNTMSTLLINIANGIGTLTLNRPQLKNALDSSMRDALREAIQSIRADRSMHAIVICGKENNFCAGGDINSKNVVDAQAGRERIDDSHEWIGTLLDLDRPVIAAVDGVAFGTGFSLALLAEDLVFTARELDADEAKQLGVAFEIVHQQTLHARAQQLAEHLANTSPAAFGCQDVRSLKGKRAGIDV